MVGKILKRRKVIHLNDNGIRREVILNLNSHSIASTFFRGFDWELIIDLLNTVNGNLLKLKSGQNFSIVDVAKRKAIICRINLIEEDSIIMINIITAINDHEIRNKDDFKDEKIYYIKEGEVINEENSSSIRNKLNDKDFLDEVEV
jgi:hypothetical protein